MFSTSTWISLRWYAWMTFWFIRRMRRSTKSIYDWYCKFCGQQLYAKLSKCNFFERKVQYLGHILCEEGIAVDLEKITTIAKWPTPRNMTNVRSFTRLAGYYRRFIKGFSQIAYPITSLQRKNVKFHWSEGCEASFQQLKKLLTSAPVLKVANPDKDFILCTDACIEGLEGVLMQERTWFAMNRRSWKNMKRTMRPMFWKLRW